ncbi:MAG: 3-hydroxyacyl-CoA dehydrogenase family protein [Puia sp.]
MPMINEAIISLQEGVASVESIDTIMKLGMPILWDLCNWQIL